jgi:hypothetical protein
MTSPALGAPGTPILPDYAPVPQASLGPAVNDQGYYVGRVERNLYWVADIEAGARTALATVDPTPYFQKYGDNLWAAVKGSLDAVADAAAAPVTEKYTGVLGAVDVFTVLTAFSILESIRLDLGYRMDVDPVSKP